MKKIWIASSFIIFVLAGEGLKPAIPSVSAEIPFAVKPLPSDATKTAPAAKPQLELLNQGAEPRRELRFKPTVNVKEKATLTLKMNTATSVAGQPMLSLDMPAMVMGMDLVATQVDPNGDIHYQFSYTDADVAGEGTLPPQAIEGMRSNLKKIIGMSGTAIVDNRGHTKASNFVLPEGSDTTLKQLLDQLSKSLEQISAPIPEETVGIGAQWRVSSSVNIGGINLNQITTYQLVELQDNSFTLNVSVEQHAGEQNFSSPQMPSGAAATVKSHHALGQGRLTQRLDRLMADRFTLSIRSNMEINVKNAASWQEMPVATKSFTEMTLESK
jgi:hypothetical protein